MAKKSVFKLNDLAIRLIIATLAILLIMLGITATGLLDVSAYTLAVAKIGAVLVIFVDIGFLSIMSKSKKGELNILTGFELVVGALVLIETAVTLMGFNTGVLGNFSGWIVLTFGVVFAFEAFVRK